MPSLFGFMPMDEGNSESLSWLTDVIRSRAGQQRIALRDAPREEYAHRFTLDEAQYARFTEFVREIGIDSFYLPVWKEATHYGTISAHSATLAFDTGYSSYAATDYAGVIDSDNDHEACLIQTVASGLLTLDPWVVRSYSDAWVAPLRLATFAQPPEVERRAGQSVVVSARFLVDKVRRQTATGINWQTYKGAPVITDRTSLFGGVTETHERERLTFDCKTAPVERTEAYATPISTSSLAWRLFGRDALWNMRCWLHGRQGQRKSLWVPSWNRDITITRDITAGDTNVQIADIDFAFTFPLPCEFIAVSLAGTSFCFRALTCYDGDPGYEHLGLESAASMSLAVANIDGTCRNILSRFASDTIRIDHDVDHSRLSIPIVEVPE